MRSAAVTILLLTNACGGQARPPATPVTASVQSEREVAAARAQVETQAARIRELEGLLSLARAEVRDLREAMAARVRPTEPVRIGASAAPVEPPAEWAEEEPTEDDGPRPTLRLYGQPAPSEIPPLVLPPAPDGVPDRLPVVPLPGETDVPEPALVAAVPAAEVVEDSGETAYRAALVLVRDRRFAEAEAAFDAFLDAHGSHPRAVDALYWRGIVRYAERDYAGALGDFRAIVSGHARSERAPEAMLEMAMCHARMGDQARARVLFERVRRTYPNSVAARLASQEDAS